MRVWILIRLAEMLGVPAGLGHLVLDTRDRRAYPELMPRTDVCDVFIGALRWLLDAAARAPHGRWTHTF